jgi:hypothetical protein
LIVRDLNDFVLETSYNLRFDKYPILSQVLICLGYYILVFLICCEIDDFTGYFTVNHFAVRGFDETIIVNPGISTQ